MKKIIKMSKKIVTFLLLLFLLFFNLNLIVDNNGWSVNLVKDIVAKEAVPPGEGGGGSGGGSGCYTYGSSEAIECTYSCWPFTCTGSYIICNYGPCICYNYWFCS